MGFFRKKKAPGGRQETAGGKPQMQRPQAQMHPEVMELRKQILKQSTKGKCKGRTYAEWAENYRQRLFKLEQWGKKVEEKAGEKALEAFSNKENKAKAKKALEEGDIDTFEEALEAELFRVRMRYDAFNGLRGEKLQR